VIRQSAEHVLNTESISVARSNGLLLAELKHHLENQLDPGSGVTFEMTPYRLIVHYRGDTVGSWQATRQGRSGIKCTKSAMIGLSRETFAMR